MTQRRCVRVIDQPVAILRVGAAMVLLAETALQMRRIWRQDRGPAFGTIRITLISGCGPMLNTNSLIISTRSASPVVFRAIRTDQGPDFTGRALDRWAYHCSVDLKLIATGNPTQHAFIESFNGKFRDECLNDHFNNSPMRGW